MNKRPWKRMKEINKTQSINKRIFYALIKQKQEQKYQPTHKRKKKNMYKDIICNGKRIEIQMKAYDKIHLIIAQNGEKKNY